MQNLNKVKGNASKMEALMKNSTFQPRVKHRKLTREATNYSCESSSSSNIDDITDDNEDVVTFHCNCPSEHHENNNDTIETFVPTVEDFIYEIENSGVLANAEKSRQLLLLMQMFFQVQDLNLSEGDTSYKGEHETKSMQLKLPPL